MEICVLTVLEFGKSTVKALLGVVSLLPGRPHELQPHKAGEGQASTPVIKSLTPFLRALPSCLITS